MYCSKVAVRITAFAMARRSAILKVTRSSTNAVLADLGCHGRSGQCSRMQAAAARFGTALANVEPEELRYSPASSSTQDSSPANVLSRAHALPENIDRVCPQRSGDYGARLLYGTAVLGPKRASRGVHAVLNVMHRNATGRQCSRCSPSPLVHHPKLPRVGSRGEP